MNIHRRIRDKFGVDLEMGIGIHTGRVIVGNIGSQRRAKYAAVGLNVNLAGRIESFTKGGQVLISEETREKVSAALRIDSQFEVEPKGAAASAVRDRWTRSAVFAGAAAADSGLAPAASSGGGSLHGARRKVLRTPPAPAFASAAPP